MELEKKQLISRMNAVYADIQKKYSDITPLLNTIAEIIESAIDENFRQYGRWDGNSNNVSLFSGGNNKWKDLADSTKDDYKRKGIEPLVRTLQRSQDMRNSINVTPQSPSSISIRMSSPYGEAHNYGFKGKVGVKAHIRKVKTSKGEKEVQILAHTREMNIPASPFLTLSEDDIFEIVEFIESQLF